MSFSRSAKRSTARPGATTAGRLRRSRRALRCARLRALAGPILGALVFRYAAFAAMCAMALVNEAERGPTLADPVLALVPYVAWVDRVNWVAWLVCYLPIAAFFLWQEPRRWVRYMICGGLVSIARGVCILVTHLGPPDPAHVGPGIGSRSFAEAWIELVSPFHVFVESSQRAYLTQDLFFSGHVATTFLLWLYVRRRPVLGTLALGGHVLSIAAVMFAHLHYTIDVVGAWAVTLGIYAWYERRARAQPRPPASGG